MQRRGNNPAASGYTTALNNGHHSHQVTISHGHQASSENESHSHTLASASHEHDNVSHSHEVDNEPEYYKLAFIYLKGESR